MNPAENSPKSLHRYFPASENDKRWGLYVTTAGLSRIPPHAHYPPDGHPAGYDFNFKTGRILDEIVMVYISKGQGWFESKCSRRQKVTAGQVFLLFPGVWHRYMPDAATGWDEHWVGFDGDLPRRWIKEKFFSPKTPVLPAGRENFLLGCFTGLMETIRANPPAMQQILSGNVMNIAGWLCSARQIPSAPGDQPAAPIQEILARLQNGFAAHIDIRQLAREIGVSYSWLRHNFSQHTGFAPHQYLLELRMACARNLLATTARPVKEIAAQSGFADEHYFSRIFKNRVGVTPNQWRDRSRHAG